MLKADPRIVGPLLFVFLGAGAVATVIAGPLADRWGARPFMVWVFLAVTPLAALFLNVTGLLWGLMAALWISALMPLAAFVAAAFLPAPRARA